MMQASVVVSSGEDLGMDIIKPFIAKYAI